MTPTVTGKQSYKVFAKWVDDGSLGQAFLASVQHLAAEQHLDLRVLLGDGTNTVAKKGAIVLATPATSLVQKGEKVIASTDNHGSTLAPVPVAPVNETDMVLFPEGLHTLQPVVKEVGLDLRGASLNLGVGFDSRANRKGLFNAGTSPNITDNPRHRKTTKRGRERLLNAAIYTLCRRVERIFAWEDKFKRLLLRFEHIQQRHYGMKLMAYPLINLRAFCGT